MLIRSVLSGLKTLHVTYYSWHDLPISLWIINECLNKSSGSCCNIAKVKFKRRQWDGVPAHLFWYLIPNSSRSYQGRPIVHVPYMLAYMPSVLLPELVVLLVFFTFGTMFLSTYVMSVIILQMYQVLLPISQWNKISL
jgi:hypothetical protein